MADTVEREFVDIERLIDSVRSKPALWDSSCTEYSNRIKKQECWRQVCQEMRDDFSSLPEDKKREIGNDYQKKWKGVRSSYAREIQKQKNTKSGSGATMRKTYVYYEQLSFLQKHLSSKDTASNTEHEDNSGPQSHESITPVSCQNFVASNRVGSNPRKRLANAAAASRSTEELCSVLTESLKQRNISEADDDRNFLLSLIGDFKKVPPSLKLDLKIEMMALLKRYSNLDPNLSTFVPTPQHHPNMPVVPPPQHNPNVYQIPNISVSYVNSTASNNYYPYQTSAHQNTILPSIPVSSPTHSVNYQPTQNSRPPSNESDSQYYENVNTPSDTGSSILDIKTESGEELI